MRKLMLDFDPVTKVRRDFHYSSDGNEFAVSYHADVSDVIEQNKALHAMTDERARYGELDRVASIPMTMYQEMRKRGIIDPDGFVQDDKAFLKWLDDKDNLAFRTRPGKLSR